jgi:hypothetical protein
MPCKSMDQFQMVIDDATVWDKCDFLVSNMDQYYSLVLLLTASEEDAERCFTLGLDAWSKACRDLAPMGQEIAHEYVKRALVDSALQICAPALGWVPNDAGHDVWDEKELGNWSPWVAAITQLDPFDRFVFVLSVLEWYSDEECSDLLHCDPKEIAESRVQAASSVASALQTWNLYDA